MFVTEGDWQVLVVTSDLDHASTNHQVYLTVFGEAGDSGALPLGEPDKGLFEQGKTDKFDVSHSLIIFTKSGFMYHRKKL